MNINPVGADVDFKEKLDVKKEDEDSKIES